MESPDEPASLSGGATDAKTELPPSILHKGTENPVPRVLEPATSPPEVYAQPETEAAVVYDPTPVIRGYDTSETEASAMVEPVVAVSQASASSAEPQRDQVPSSTVLTAPLMRPPLDPPTPEAPETVAPVPATLEAPVVVDAFKSRVLDTWSLMFGSRYEDDDVHETTEGEDTKQHEDDPTHNGRTPQTNISTRPIRSSSSLRSKLDHGRKLDQQLQGGRRTRVRQRPGSSRSADPEPPNTAQSSTRSTKATEPWLTEEQPFQDAGLTPTIVRFCLEQAIPSTVHCIAQLHAMAQDEPEPARGDVELGIFLTQWELDSIVNDLFGSTTTASSTTSPHGRLLLHNPEYASLPQQTLLQVSWFLPLDQLPRLRSLVAQICRKHLSDRKLAVLNTTLHRHFVLRPHPGVKMQRLLLRILGTLTPKAQEVTRRGTGNQADEKEREKEVARFREVSRALVQELLHAIYVRIPPQFSLTIQDFMRLAPFDLVTTIELTSMLTVQRIVFFRFLIEALACEKANVSVGVNSWWPRSTGKPSSTSRLDQRRASEAASAHATSRTSHTSVTKRRKKKQPDKTTVNTEASTDRHDDGRTEVDSEAPVQSTHASHGSGESPRQSKLVQGTEADQKADELTPSDFTKLYRSLTVALGNLVKTQPWLLQDEDERAIPTTASAAAVRASFLAAEAFQQSLVLLESTGTSASSSISRKIQEFTDTINELTRRHDAEETPQPPEYTESQERQQFTPCREPAKAIPPPVQRADSNSSLFPPPYVTTTPSYWTFDPDLPAPSTPTDNSSSIPRSIAKAKASPGVARSDKLTFLQRKGFTFSKGGLEPVAESSKTPTPKRKPRTERINSVDSTVSNDPPEYTHWASAATNLDRKTGSTMTERLLMDDDEDDDVANVETRVREALRMQQSFALDDMVQSLLHRGRPVVSPAATRTKPTPRARSTASQPPTRVVSRVRSATARASASVTASTKISRPQPQPLAYEKRPTKKPMPPHDLQQPQRDYEPPADDAHLQWAARVSEFYQAKLKAVVASSGGS